VLLRSCELSHVNPVSYVLQLQVVNTHMQKFYTVDLHSETRAVAWARDPDNHCALIYLNSGESPMLELVMAVTDHPGIPSQSARALAELGDILEERDVDE
jgi:hypothetical protein